MAKIKKTSPLLNLTGFQTFLVDTNPLSDYFRISELGDLLTSGKNGFLIEGSTHLKPSTEVKIEILDTEGNPIYVEPGNGIPEYYEGLSKLISVHVYQDTPIGIGKITILGELETYIDDNGFVQSVPDDWKGVYNVKWERDIKINKNIPNESRIRFTRRPQVIIEELNESFYSRDLTTATQTDATVRGIALTPSEGTSYTGFRGGVRYLIQKESGIPFKDGGTRITINGTSLNDVEVVEYLNETTLVIQIPYTDSNNVISNFSGKTYSLTYQYNSNPVASSILGSFGRFEINYLETFVGDVERIKVFKKSRASNVDYEVIQDTRVTSAELLTTIVSGSNIDTGHFSASYEGGKNWNEFWVTQSNAGNILDSSKIYRAVKLQNNRLSSNLGDNIRLESGSEYTLEFYNYYETSSNQKLDTLKVYLTSTERSGSGIANYVLTQSIDILSGSNERRSANKVSYNFYPSITDNWTVHFEADNTTANSYWHVGSVSLQAAHEAGFSPDEFQFIIPVNRNLERETFDFKFEFFDINNNYVPITTTYPKTFQSGNIGLIDKNIIIDTDKQFFNFSSSLEGLPSEQIINITGTKNRILGNLLITSQAFDTGGIAIPAATYSNAGYAYPGALTNYNEDLYSLSASLDIANFTGSLHTSSLVDRITYTLTETESIQPFVKRFTISRLVAGASGQDGINSKILSVSANTNQFLYKATNLALNPSGQTIYIDVKKQNLLSSSIEPIRISSSSASAPAINSTSGSEVGGVTRFTLNGSLFPYSLGEVIYAFTGSDELLNPYYDIVKITPVKILDGFSVIATNENTSFAATSTGTVSGGYAASSGSILVKVGNEPINYSSTFVTNSFSASISSSTSAGINVNSFNGTDYSISNLSIDSGSLVIDVKYKDGGGTIISSSKEITYSKVKKSAPLVTFNIVNSNQSTNAYSNGIQSGSFIPVTMSVSETYNGITTTSVPTTISGISVPAGAVTFGISSSKQILTASMDSVSYDSGDIILTGTYTDQEGSSRNISGSVSLVKVKKASPTTLAILSSETQTILSSSAGYATPSTFTISVNEGGTNYTYDDTVPYASSSFRVSSISGGSNSSGTITPTTPSSTSGTTVSLTIAYVNSEGTAGTITKTHKVAVSLEGQKGNTGDPGSNGSDGKRTATGMVHYQITASSAPATPSATSYNFSTGVFTGLTANWGTGAPTYASGNSNKYWYAIYTVVETTAGGGTGTPTFGSPTQAIGFSGLVSFTAANNVSDGSNTLSFGVAGATLINGSNISTGKIISTNYIAGTPYTTSGSIIDLDNGRIATRTFYIDSNGDATFKGTLSAAGGTFTGNLSAAGGSFTGALVAAGGTFAGDVTAAGGKIGGWTIDSSSIYVPNAISLNSSAKTITIADTSGVPRVNFNTNTAFSSLSAGLPTTVSGTGTNYNSGPYSPGNFDRNLGGMASVNNRTYNITTTWTQANGTTALTISSGTPNTIDVWSQIVVDNGVTTTVVAEYKDGVTFGSSATWAAINNKVVSTTMTGNGNTWTVYQRFKWTYQGTTSYTANLYNQPAVSVTLAGANSFVEIIAGGIQVGRDSANYVIMDRAGAAAMLQVGGEGTFTGDVTANTSDRRLKDNIRLIDNPLEKLEKINGVYFNWNKVAKQLANKSDNEEVGFLAQEVQSVLPHIIKPAPFDIDTKTGESKSGENYLTIQYEKIVPLLVEAIKELKKEIEELKKNR
jgi:hypothetical protein